MRDVIALSALATKWANLDSAGLAAALAEALLSSLDLDLVYMHMVQPTEELPLEIARSKHCSDPIISVAKVKGAVAQLLEANRPLPISTLPDPFSSITLRATVFPFELAAPKAILVVASERVDFPTDEDMLLLSVVTNQAALGLQRLNTERALKASQEHLRAVLDSAGDGIYVMGADSLCTYLNPIGAAMLGYRTEELVGHSVHEIIHHTHVDGSSHPVTECPIFLTSRQGIPSHVSDDVFWHKNGIAVPVSYSVAPVMEDGLPSGAVVTFRNISERKLAEVEQMRLLRTVETERALLADIFQRSPSFMCVLLGSDHVVQQTNEHFMQLIGHREILGMPMREALPEVVDQGFVALLDSVFATGVAQGGSDVSVVLQRSPKGPSEQRYVNFMYQAYRDPDGGIGGVFVQGVDFTERRHAEEDLLRVSSESEARMAQMLSAEQQHGLLLTQVANASRTMGHILSMDSIARVLTEEARSMLGAHQAVTSLTVSAEWAQAINAVSLSEKFSQYRNYSPTPDGSGIYSEVCRTNLPMRLTQAELEAHPAWKGFGEHAKEHPRMRGWLAVPLVGHGGRNLGLVQLSDKFEGEFTEQDQAILVQLAAIAATGIENASLYERVRDQDRRKDEFLAILAHELRNPLAPIRTGLTLLKVAPSIEATAKTTEIMERQVGYMVDLIDDLLDVSRITSGKIQLKKERLEVRTVLDSALELSRPLIEGGHHQMFLSMLKEPFFLHADPTRMAQIVSNLLNNAAKYTPPGRPN
ncbi:hypothetical protein CR105_26675 [Massilia eurypsychrophila]|uniref:histidine kinase n=1 Tax=Massilia eurypsychrophila TaxID=1485217 RepID=A0A2G8T7Q0_9BURK|nr:PAS domain S-box protein [Massilia eurypsychrophila]PIL41993.1 hypothetical protein CR105_26675 [Massilia eurypsychrophila]